MVVFWQQLGENSILGILFGLLALFALIAVYYRDKYFKIQDELLDLADRRDFFSKKPSIMYFDERKLFEVLQKLYSDKYLIFPQVRLAAILEVKNDVKEHDNLYRVLDHLSLDFVIFDKVLIAPLVAIELNGKSHFQLNRKNRDRVVENILVKSGIKFIAIQSAEKYNENEIKEAMNGLLPS